MRDRPTLDAVGIGLAAALVFDRALGNGFVLYDDPAYVLNNPPVAGGLTAHGARWALTAFHSANWHPLTWLSHMLDVTLFGLAPWGHHLTSVLLHGLAAALVYLFLRAATSAPGRSAAAALLFALHPLRVESVAWVAERKDVLSLVFALATLLAWLRWTRAPSAGRYLAALALFACGLASKSMLVTLPCVLLLLDGWPLARWRGAGGEHGAARLLREKLPFFALAAVAAVLAVQSQRSFGATRSLEALGLGARAANAVLAYGVYLAKTAWPTQLACIYPHPRVLGADTTVATLAAGAALLVLLGLAWTLRRRVPALLFGTLWFLGTLVPVIGLVQIGNQGWADRYTYLPGIGLAVAVVWAVAALPLARPALVTLLVVVLLALSGLTWRQLGTWRDSETLFRHATLVTKRNYVAWSNLGIALTRAEREDEAMAAYREALRARPDHAEANNNLGGLLLRAGHLEEAQPFLEQAVRTNPRYVEAHLNLGWATARAGRPREALRHYEDAVAVAPRNAGAQLELGKLLLQLDRRAEALEHLEAAAALGHPRAAEALARARAGG